MNSKLFKLIISAFYSTSLFAIGGQIYIKDLGFDRESKEFHISYSTTDSHSTTTLKDSGALPLCVVEQLMREYYRRMSNESDQDKNPNFSQKHLVLLNQVSAMIPPSEGSQVRESLRNYIQNFRKEGIPVLKTIREATLSLLKDRKISVLEETVFDPNEKPQIETEINRISGQLVSLKTKSEEDAPNLKSLLVRSFEGKLEQLREQLRTLPTQSSKKEKQISAIESVFCASPFGPFILKNNEIGSLLDKLSEEVASILPKALPPESHENDSHFQGF